MKDLKETILSIIKQPGLACLATINEQGNPWARYVIVVGDDNMVIRCATFTSARKVHHIEKNPEVHMVAGVKDMMHHSNYLQIQGKAEVSYSMAEKESLWSDPFWKDSLTKFFKGPDDPNFGVIIIKPYRIEYWGDKLEPDVWEA